MSKRNHIDLDFILIVKLLAFDNPTNLIYFLRNFQNETYMFCSLILITVLKLMG